MYKHLLVAVDGSEAAQAAAHSALQLAKSLAAKMSLYHAKENIDAYYFDEGFAMGEEVLAALDERATEEGNKLMGRIKALADTNGVVCQSLMDRPPSAARGIIEAARTQACDLIVMGSHGRGAIASVILGSVAQKVLHHATLPVLVIR